MKTIIWITMCKVSTEAVEKTGEKAVSYCPSKSDLIIELSIMCSRAASKMTKHDDIWDNSNFQS
jgi:hypothetical protein